MAGLRPSTAMNESITVIISGRTIVDCDGTDEKAIAMSLKLFAETIERHGLRHAKRVLPTSKVLREVLFAEAQCGSSYLSTVVG